MKSHGKTLIVYQGVFGGTDFLLGRLERWMKEQGFCVESVIAGQLPSSKRYDKVFLPTSEMNMLWRFCLKGIVIKKICIWAMGYAAFKGAYVSIRDEKFFLDPLSKNKFKYNLIKIIKWRARSACQVFLNNKALAFTDEVGAYADIGNFGCSLKDKIFPIVVDRVKHRSEYTPAITELRLGWLGRVDFDFKYYSLLKIIMDVCSFLRENNTGYRKVIFHVVGSGNGLEELKKKLTCMTEVDFLFVHNLPPVELSNYLACNIDLMFAMGTSALESAKNCIPTVIVQPMASPEDFNPEGAYRWLHRSKGLSLGEMSYGAENLPQEHCSMNKIISDFNFRKFDLSKLDYEYVSNFDAEVVFPRFMTFSDNGVFDVKAFFKSFELDLIKFIKKNVKNILRFF